MPNRVAVLSDIHGVLPALEAVLAEPDVGTADRIVLTGDITAGPQPAQVLDLLTGLGDRVVRISGNADRELLEHRRGNATRSPIRSPPGRPDSSVRIISAFSPRCHDHSPCP